MLAADAAMRQRLNDPTWQRPNGYTWNHAGVPGARVMELVRGDLHAAVAHQGNATVVRAQMRASRVPLPGSGVRVRTVSARAFVVYDVYVTFRDAARAAGIIQPDYTVEEAPYYFSAEDGSVFIVREPNGFLFRAAGVAPSILYVAGPRRGNTRGISFDDAQYYRELGEERWGRLVQPFPSWFFEPRFIPGTDRETLPWTEDGDWVGYIDQTGYHRFSPSEFRLRNPVPNRLRG